MGEEYKRIRDYSLIAVVIGLAVPAFLSGLAHPGWRPPGARPDVEETRQARHDFRRAGDAVDVGEARWSGQASEARVARLLADVPDQVVGQEPGARARGRRGVRHGIPLHAVIPHPIDVARPERVRDPAAVGRCLRTAPV